MLLLVILKALILGTGLVSGECANKSNSTEIKLGLLLRVRSDTGDINDMDHILPAVEIAVAEVNNETFKNKTYCFRLFVQEYGPHCDRFSTAPLQAARIDIQENIDAFLGPSCKAALDGVSHMAYLIQKPFIMASGGADVDRRPCCLKPVTQFGSSYKLEALAIGEFLDHFGYSDTCILANHRSFEYRRYARILVEKLAAHAPSSTIYEDHKRRDLIYFKNMLDECSRKSRVIILVFSAEVIRMIMVAAKMFGYANGEYVFICPATEQSLPRLEWKINDTYDDAARKGFMALFTLTSPVIQTTRCEALRKRVMERYRQTGFKFEKVPSEAFIFHDIVHVYGLVYNEILSAGLQPDVTTILDHLWNRTFHGGITSPIDINELGNRLLNYFINDFDHERGEFVPVMELKYAANRYTIRQMNRTIDWISSGVPPNKPTCGFDGNCQVTTYEIEEQLMIAMVALLFLPMVIGMYFVNRRLRKKQHKWQMTWRVHADEISHHRRSMTRSNMTFATVVTSSLTVQDRHHTKAPFTKTILYKGVQVVVKYCNTDKVEITKELLKDLCLIHDFQHDNINKFVAACTDPYNICVLFQFEPKGSLQDLLARENIRLDWDLKLSLLQDLANGVRFIHHSHIHSHGYLKSSKCLIDNRFVLKITHYGLHQFNIHTRKLAANEVRTENEKYTQLLWRSPELLLHFVPPYGTQAGDIYSLGIIIEELLTDGAGPYAEASCEYSAREIIEMVMYSEGVTMRPALRTSHNYPDEIIDLARKCWTEEDHERPNIDTVLKEIKKMNRKALGKTLIEVMLERVEKYASDLETLVEEKSGKWLEEKKKAEQLLEQMLPKSIADQLKRGQPVVPETYKCVTIYFSDIVGFTQLCSTSQPLEVVDMLNDMYTSFDSVINLFSVYKIETIGDAYMVASGLPERNGNEHAREISNMALVLLARIKSLKIRHKPDITLQLRIGIHSGPVVTGVVGIKMPRFCLFGDTVNTASRMETCGEAMRIHVSEDTKIILDNIGTFSLEPRGEISVKGKGYMKTHWLLGSDISHMKILDKTTLGIKGTKITENSMLHTTYLPVRIVTAAVTTSSRHLPTFQNSQSDLIPLNNYFVY